LWIQEAQTSINNAISELDQQAAKIFKVKANLSECMDDMIAENTKLRSKLRGLGTYIADCGVKAETATNALAKM
jgi:regulator of replication initiation timing